MLLPPNITLCLENSLVKIIAQWKMMFKLRPCKVNNSIFPLWSNSLMNCLCFQGACVLCVSLEMQWCLGRVIRPESLCIIHADGFLTERPN